MIKSWVVNRRMRELLKKISYPSAENLFPLRLWNSRAVVPDVDVHPVGDRIRPNADLDAHRNRLYFYSFRFKVSSPIKYQIDQHAYLCGRVAVPPRSDDK